MCSAGATMKKSKCTRLALDARGTASVEIVVMLPVFVVLFCAGFYVHSWAQAKQEALTSARACAFQYAMNGCKAVDEGVDLCAGAEPQKLEDSEQSPGLLAKIEKVPLIGATVQMLFGEGARAAATRSNEGFMNDEQQASHEQVVLVCNTRSRTILGHVQDSFCDLADYVVGGGIAIPGC
jgi:hypothetical protein